MKKIKRKINNRNDWGGFAIGYLNLAYLALNALATELSGKEKTEQDDSFLDIRYNYVAAIYNLKHGIEILLKTVLIEFLEKKDIDPSVDHSHEIDEIFNKLKIEVPEKKLKNAISSFENKNPDNNTFKDNKRSIYDQLEELVEKYQSLDFLKNKIEKDYKIRDFENTTFRYPVNNLSIQIDYEKVIKKITESDILEALIDCSKLKIILYQLYIILYSEKNKAV